MSGKKNDSGKPDMALIPAAAALEEAHLWADGKKKYSAYNWYDGILYMRILSAMERHLTLLKAGIDFDYETKRHHGAAIRCGSAMLIQFSLEQRTELDDRMKMSEEVKKKIEDMAKGESIFDILNNVNEKQKRIKLVEEENKAIENLNDFSDMKKCIKEELSLMSEISSRSLENDMDSKYIPKNSGPMYQGTSVYGKEPLYTKEYINGVKEDCKNNPFLESVNEMNMKELHENMLKEIFPYTEDKDLPELVNNSNYNKVAKATEQFKKERK